MAAIAPAEITPLRQRILDTQQLRGMAPRTQGAYFDAVSSLAGSADQAGALCRATGARAAG